MSHVTITVKTDSAAFRPDAEGFDPGPLDTREVARVVQDVTEQIKGGRVQGIALDYNGNTVATFAITEDES